MFSSNIKKNTSVFLKKGTEESYKHPAGFLKPVVNSNRCEGKGPCVAVCPVDVFEIHTLPKDLRINMTLIGRIKGFAHGWQQAIVVNPDACRACGLCVVACPEKAITLARNTSDVKSTTLGAQ